MKKERLIESMKRSKYKIGRRMRRHDAPPSHRQIPYLNASWEDYLLYRLLRELYDQGWRIAVKDLEYFG